jgi:2-polyprenyl-3-methyl-5-hydroxy-6-metoxy-1,4-benzoquinol methylase
MKKKICPVCKSKKTKLTLRAFNGHAKHVFSTKKEFQYDECLNCGSVFLSNIPIDSSFYKKYYDTKYRTVDRGVIFKLGMILVSLANKTKIKTIQKNIQTKSPITLLDIGSGHGDFIAQLNHSQFTPSGIEIEKDLVQEAKHKGITMYHGDFLDYDFKNKKLDCITLWHVIEHIPNPQKLLRKIHKLLKKDGIFIFSTPSTHSLGFQFGKENWFHLEAPRHIILYNQKSLQYIADTHDFTILETKNNYLEFPTDLYWSLRNYKQKLKYYLFYPFYKYGDSETITSVWRKN